MPDEASSSSVASSQAWRATSSAPRRGRPIDDPAGPAILAAIFFFSIDLNCPARGSPASARRLLIKSVVEPGPPPAAAPARSMHMSPSGGVPQTGSSDGRGTRRQTFSPRPRPRRSRAGATWAADARSPGLIGGGGGTAGLDTRIRASSGAAASRSFCAALRALSMRERAPSGRAISIGRIISIP